MPENMGPERRIRIVIVDTHMAVRESLALVLTGFVDMRVVGQGSIPDDAIRLCAEVKPDLVLMEFSESAGAIDAIRVIRDRYPAIKIIAVTSFDGDDVVRQRALATGATICLHKQASLADFVQAIRN